MRTCVLCQKKIRPWHQRSHLSGGSYKGNTVHLSCAVGDLFYQTDMIAKHLDRVYTLRKAVEWLEKKKPEWEKMYAEMKKEDDKNVTE